MKATIVGATVPAKTLRAACLKADVPTKDVRMIGPRAWVELPHDGRRLPDPVDRDVRVDIAAAEKNRGPGEGAAIVFRQDFRSDQGAAQRGNAAVTHRIAGGKSQRQASPLREAEEDRAFRRERPRRQAGKEHPDQL